MTEERSSDSNKLIKNSSNDKFKDQTGDKNQVEMSILKVSKNSRNTNYLDKTTCVLSFKTPTFRLRFSEAKHPHFR